MRTATYILLGLIVAHGLTPSRISLAQPPAPAAGDVKLDVQRMRGLEWTTFVPKTGSPILVDGRTDDWSWTNDVITIDGSIVPARGWATPVPEGDEDLSARVKLAWSDRHLYVAARIRDDELFTPSPLKGWTTPYGHDSLVLLVAPSPWLTSGSRSAGTVPKTMSFGFSYGDPAMAPRPLGNGARYAMARAENGYSLEAQVPFKLLGWKPSRAGDRFPFAFILVDRDPGKPVGKQFDQYGWNFGRGSWADMGQARLVNNAAYGSELVPAMDKISANRTLPFAGSADTAVPARISALEVIVAGQSSPVYSVELDYRLESPGHYVLTGQIPMPDLRKGRYDMRLRIERSISD